jgi:predicted RNA methylase/HEAT repeat protein
MSERDVETLIAALDTEDARERRAASQALLAAGEAATEALVAALGSERADAPPPPAVRKAAAYLLGQARVDASVVAALVGALGDAEPKVRQNAAVSLGRLRAIEGAAALAEALDREEVGYVRPSILLALGAIGGDAARAALGAVEPRDGAEREALAKALDRAAPRAPRVSWREDTPWRWDTVLEAAVGLEDVALEEAAEQGIAARESGMPGRLALPHGLPPWQALPRLRCAYEVRICGGQGPPLSWARLAESGEEIAALIAASEPVRAWREWLRSEEGIVPYRFALETPPPRPTERRALVAAARAACAPLGWIDRPSHYAVELLVAGGEEGSRLFIRPHFAPDPRFAYRKRYVGAAIHPAVGACLARRARTGPKAVVLDPTCGSGTLLVERALLGARRLVGLDVSPTAVAAARANVREAGLERRITIRRADAAGPDDWPACDEVIANLPFGLRTRHAGMDPARLYRAIVARIAAALRPGGRALLYTAHRAALEAALAAHADRLTLVEQRRVRAGGLWVFLWVLAAN